MMADVTVIDYGMGNIGSVTGAFARLGATTTVASSPEELAQARALVLPGVGAFPAAMENIRSRGLEQALRNATLDRRVPFLGICLGLQLIAEDSDEGGHTRGLAWIPGHVRALKPANALPVPHVGWNEVAVGESELFDRVGDAAHFYFDHSYALQSDDQLSIATCDYGGKCVAAVQAANIYAVQFHPEKSQRNGLRVLRNFLRLAQASHAIERIA